MQAQLSLQISPQKSIKGQNDKVRKSIDLTILNVQADGCCKIKEERLKEMDI